MSNLSVCCRHELPSDLEVIRAVESAAFGRAAGALAVSALAEVDGKIVGHVAFSPVRIEDDQESLDALALAPMAMLPKWQQKGIGSALLRWSLDECRRGGHKLVIVLGHPKYYPRFGFIPAMPFGVRCPFEVPSEAFMLLELRPGALAGREGTVRYRPEFASL
jgi:putative acetyltransferase